jgi:hypothetical protein
VSIIFVKNWRSEVYKSNSHLRAHTKRNFARIFYTFLPIWKTFDTEGLHVAQLNSIHFCENRCNEKHTSLRSKWKFACHFCTFLPIWIKFGKKDFHAMPLGNLRDSWDPRGKSHALLVEYLSVYPYSYRTYSKIFLKFGTRDLNINSQINCEFRGRWFRKSHSFLTGVYLVTCKIVPWRDAIS